MIFNYAFRLLVLFALLVLAHSCSVNKSHTEKPIAIAVIADAHLQNIYGQLEDSEYQGVVNPKNGQYALIRTMQSQLESTRIFNENYFAFLAALDDIVERNIKYVILPGDFSDDGQPLHIRGLKNILDLYTQDHGLTFLLITGNHDVVYPFDHEDGKRDFLGPEGKPRAIASTPTFKVKGEAGELPLVVSQELRNLGYKDIAHMLGAYGFFPKKGYRYWATPFSDYTYENYSFKAAEAGASLEKRSSRISQNKIPLPDISYVVEPVEGVWLLALDANTYLNKEQPQKEGVLQEEYKNNGRGLDNLLTHKKYLVEWVKKVAAAAKKHQKTLIAFSHYPMADFNNGATPYINELLVGGKMQLNRVPKPILGTTLADAGLQLHLGGHMHLNDTGISTSKSGNTLINIQTPSLAAYMPAYKILELVSPGKIRVKTVVVDSVPRFNEFFGLYEQEHDHLRSIGESTIWNRNVLGSTGYGDLMAWHLKELVRLRFLPSEWPQEFAHFLMALSGKELALLSRSNSKGSLTEQLEHIRKTDATQLVWLSNKKQDGEAKSVPLEPFEKWTGKDLVTDLYKLRSADQLAFSDIGKERLKHYRLICNSFLNKKTGTTVDPMYGNMVALMHILQNFMSGEPSLDFEIDLKTGQLKPIEDHENQTR